MFHKMPFILAAVIVAAICLDGVIPVEAKSVLYALSLTIKSGIIFVLPVIIFMLLFKTLSQFSRQGTKMIFVILGMVCLSNFVSTMISYEVGSSIYNLELSIGMPQGMQELAPAWDFVFPKLFANDKALFSGLILGILFSLFQPALAEKISSVFDKVVNVVLKMVISVIPFFIAGFVVKLIHDKVMESIIKDYALIFVLVAITQFTYVGLLYFIANGFSMSRVLQSIRNMLPATVVGFGAMSSAAALPLTLVGAEKNTQNKDLCRLTVPSTVNIHLIGDCLAIPIFAFAILKNFGVAEPAFASYLIFALYFVLAKFSVAAIPGGGIMVMLPILESHLGFDGTMSSLITALYILFDPVITCANVSGNGAFAMIIDRISAFAFGKSEAVAEPVAIKPLTTE